MRTGTVFNKLMNNNSTKRKYINGPTQERVKDIEKDNIEQCDVFYVLRVKRDNYITMCSNIESEKRIADYNEQILINQVQYRSGQGKCIAE